MKNGAITLVLAAATVALAACGSDSSTTPAASKIVTFKAILTPGAEVPATNSSATGTFIATLDTSTNVFTYDVSCSGLTSNIILGHIHGPASATAVASPILNFASLPGATFTTGATTGTAHGTVLLTSATQINSSVNGDSLKKLLFAGLTYANIHTTLNGGGEIRGQITKQ